MSWLDLLIALIVTVPVFFGYRKGFVRKLLGIIGILVGFFLAVRFYSPISALLGKIIKADPVINNIIAFLLILTAVYLLFIWAASSMTNMNSGTKMVDKIAGAVTGFIQGLIVASILLVNLTSLDLPSQSVRDSSLMYKPVVRIAPSIFDRLIEITPGIKSTYEEYKQQLLKK